MPPPRLEKGAISVYFVRRSVCLIVRPLVMYIANNSRTQRPSVPKFGSKVPHLRCDSHTSFKVKRSKIRVRGGRGHTVSAESGGHTACLPCFQRSNLLQTNLVNSLPYLFMLFISIRRVRKNEHLYLPDIW